MSIYSCRCIGIWFPNQHRDNRDPVCLSWGHEEVSIGYFFVCIYIVSMHVIKNDIVFFFMLNYSLTDLCLTCDLQICSMVRHPDVFSTFCILVSFQGLCGTFSGWRTSTSTTAANSAPCATSQWRPSTPRTSSRSSTWWTTRIRETFSGAAWFQSVERPLSITSSVRLFIMIV